MSNTFLLELGLEEMPAHVVTPSINQFAQRITEFLKENRLNHGEVYNYSTPRRLAVIIEDLADKQEDIDELAKGPAKKIAQDEDGNWSKAAIGFAKGQGGSPDDIFFQELKGTEYAYIQKHEVGLPANKVLEKINEPLEAMVFPTRMHWGSTRFEYIRPIHWLVAMLDNQIINTKILDIQAGNSTRGHRFLGHTDIEIKTATDYVQTLKDDFVFADALERKNIIESQIEKIAKDNDWNIDIDQDLLEEVNNLVEYPTAFYGNFDSKYLSIPDEVLITSMKDNQRYFYAKTKDNKLAPVFIGVRNGNQKHIENVIAGNEKVLVARLEDAQFFYQEDQKHDINFYVEKLKNVTFHVKIGSIFEKMERTTVAAQVLAKYLSLNADELEALKRASMIYKFDLVTNMVDEFPELQGIMGEKYAELMGETSTVAKAIREHYMPTTAEGNLPESKVGSVLAIADKLDSIMSFFAVDLIPSGSNDPYALRRQAYGIDRIMQYQSWDIPLDMIQDEIIKQLDTKIDFSAHKNDVTDFVLERLRQLFKGEDIDKDIVETTIKSSTKSPLIIIELAELLKQKRNNPEFKGMIESLSRVNKLASKADSTNTEIDIKLFQNDSEQALFDSISKIDTKQTIEVLFEQMNDLSPIINKYFDETMIMDKDEKIKNNRLAQLRAISDINAIFGDLEELVIK
ncbi:glycine--tRNA ligase beta subunit [Companilactobacillus sp. RD055328]|uniref:glycine--tRNA ligase subunit beta n=1 Tax=Companilactobacillus sp. RD055328 TaxID=2916634 RepID=UPI001FC85FD5|nr:glycine--tRNA ligase subunit beta [Companilactobacillus sp. RD055328]GKQ42663.1 glycine--tRNA ligase beta subunit [Companilactobacillus sp. RD055328]